jgi:Leucine-rich repeat (LRR) protein
MKTGKFLLSKLKLLRLAVLVSMLGSLMPAKAQVNYADSLALVEFYNSTNGSGWSSSDNWLTGPVSSWEGVTVTSGRVTSLYLPFKNVTGTLPYHIGFLQKLTFFGLPGNAVGGQIPAAIIFLNNLETLDLSDNQFTGGIPPLLGLNLKLQSVNLGRNDLSGNIPASIALLQKITFLDLSGNALTGQIPPALGFLNKIERLYLYDNQLTGSIPNSIGLQRRVVEINLSGNKLSGPIPSSLGDLDSLVRFNVSNNDLTGNVPATVTSLPQLFQFDISGNELSGLPNLTTIATLGQLRVRDNRFTFEDLEPNKPKLPSASFYIPQDSVGTVQTVTLCAGDTLRLTADFTGSLPNNRYQWRSTDGTFVGPISADPVLVIPNVQPSNSKTYFTRCSNTVVTALNIIRRPVQVTVTGCSSAVPFESEASVYPTSFENQATVKITTAQDEDLDLVILNNAGHVEENINGLKTNQEVKIGEHLKRGMYYLQTTYGGKKEVRRIIKK